ncbi:hypothetical protein [Streptomyces hebeiensis]
MDKQLVNIDQKVAGEKSEGWGGLENKALSKTSRMQYQVNPFCPVLRIVASVNVLLPPS